MANRGYNFFYINNHFIYRLCPTLRSNIFLRGHCKYKSNYCNLPYIGKPITYWIWGNFAVRGGGATLNRFFKIHFLAPLILCLLVGAHLLFLHNKGWSNPIGLSDLDKRPVWYFLFYACVYTSHFFKSFYLYRFWQFYSS